MKVGLIDYGIIWFYIIAILFIGIYYAGRMRNLGDFIVSGRRIAWPLALAGICATGVGAGYTTAYVSLAYANGFMVGLIAYIASAASLAVGAALAGRLRATEAYTLSDIVDTYYGRFGRIVAGFAGVFCAIAWVGVQYITVGILLEVIVGIPRMYGSILALVVVVTYTTLGGLWSVTTTDMLQWTIATVFIFAMMTAIGISKAGGIVGFSKIPEVYFTLSGKMTFTAMITLCMSYFFGEMLVPWYAQRYLASRNSKHAAITGWGWVIYLILVVGTTMVVTAMVGHVLAPGIDPDTVFSTMVAKLLPPVVVGLAFSAILAAVMSTADSLINAAVAHAMRDIYQSFINPSASDRQYLMWARIVTIVFGILPFVFVLVAPKLWKLISYTYLFWAPGIFVPVVVALFWGKASPQSGTYGMIAGIVAALVWLFGFGEPYGINSVAVGVFACAIVMFITHPLTKNITPGKWCTPINPIGKVEYVESGIRRQM